MKARRPCRGHAGVLPKPQASTGLRSYVRSSRGAGLRNRPTLYLHHDDKVDGRSVWVFSAWRSSAAKPQCCLHGNPIFSTGVIPGTFYFLFVFIFVRLDLEMVISRAMPVSLKASCGNIKIYVLVPESTFLSPQKNLTTALCLILWPLCNFTQIWKIIIK